MADDRNLRLICPSEEHLVLVPLERFDLPQEPPMRVEASVRFLTVGVKTAIKVIVSDPKVQLEYRELPAGAESTAAGLVWTPTSSQVGPITIPVTLSWLNIQRDVELEFEIAQSAPSR